MDREVRGSQARSVFPTQDISLMGTATAKQEEKSRHTKEGRKEREHYKGEKSQTRPN